MNFPLDSVAEMSEANKQVLATHLEQMQVRDSLKMYNNLVSESMMMMASDPVIDMPSSWEGRALLQGMCRGHADKGAQHTRGEGACMPCLVQLACPASFVACIRNVVPFPAQCVAKCCEKFMNITGRGMSEIVHVIQFIRRRYLNTSPFLHRDEVGMRFGEFYSEVRIVHMHLLCRFKID